mmetsp:Transcript_89142/g.186267  ORF Transcript_89142/g.186267 Transcript_89142/m.186267 type:complete len:388 (-) Transcript_89142:30-1193(-)
MQAIQKENKLMNSIARLKRQSVTLQNTKLKVQRAKRAREEEDEYLQSLAAKIQQSSDQEVVTFTWPDGRHLSTSHETIRKSCAFYEFCTRWGARRAAATGGGGAAAAQATEAAAAKATITKPLSLPACAPSSSHPDFRVGETVPDDELRRAGLYQSQNRGPDLFPPTIFEGEGEEQVEGVVDEKVGRCLEKEEAEDNGRLHREDSETECETDNDDDDGRINRRDHEDEGPLKRSINFEGHSYEAMRHILNYLRHGIEWLFVLRSLPNEEKDLLLSEALAVGVKSLARELCEPKVGARARLWVPSDILITLCVCDSLLHSECGSLHPPGLCAMLGRAKMGCAMVEGVICEFGQKPRYQDEDKREFVWTVEYRGYRLDVRREQLLSFDS